MKRRLQLLFLILIVSIIGLSSCTKSPELSLIGNWKVTECHEEGDAFIELKEGDTWSFTNGGAFSGSFEGGFFLSSCDYVCDGNSLTLRGGDFANWHVENKPAEIIYRLDIDNLTNESLTVSGTGGLYIGGVVADCIWTIQATFKRK